MPETIINFLLLLFTPVPLCPLISVAAVADEGSCGGPEGGEEGRERGGAAGGESVGGG